MLTWVKSLVAEGSGMGQPDAEVADATRTGGSTTGTTDAGRTDGGATDRAAPPGRSGRPSEEQLLLELPVSKVDVYCDLGLQPAEFLVWVVEENGGQMWQGDLVETTGWSKSTVSRYLCSREAKGTLERLQVGRRKLVYTPEKSPDLVNDDDWPDTPRA